MDTYTDVTILSLDIIFISIIAIIANRTINNLRRRIERLEEKSK